MTYFYIAIGLFYLAIIARGVGMYLMHRDEQPKN